VSLACYRKGSSYPSVLFGFVGETKYSFVGAVSYLIEVGLITVRRVDALENSVNSKLVLGVGIRQAGMCEALGGEGAMKFEVVCETVVEEKAKMFRWFVGIFFEQ